MPCAIPPQICPLTIARIDHPATVLDHDVAEDVDHPRVPIDFDGADVGRLGPASTRCLEVEDGVEPVSELRRQRERREVRKPRHVGDRTALRRRPLDADDTVGDLEVVDRCLEQSATTASTRPRTIPAAPTTAPLARVAARLPPVATRLNGCRSVSPCTTRTDADREPELVGRELRQRGLVALAMRLLAREHRRRAVDLDPHTRPLQRALLVGEPERRRVVSRAGCRLEVRADPDAHETTGGARLELRLCVAARSRRARSLLRACG